MEVCGRALNVEIAKSLPQKPSLDNSSSSSVPMMMQQAVAMQQMQFQQAILMQQAMATQQAANKAATMKSATELAAARAAEISRKLNPNGVGNDEKEADQKPRWACSFLPLITLSYLLRTELIVITLVQVTI